ncbi:MAG: Rieske 2Fe-2S domain-containing protein [Deltaproteobacteria bacterium]|nr:Rieske 2Fe-2S domain-containing protein [Deltaproteobacteria bacterium]
MDDDEWVGVAAGLAVGESKTVKKGKRQLAVFRLAEDRACVIDNRCPHEGYPLSGGAVSGQDGDAVLTCAWHNWKFRLADGACIVGGEGVRRYDTRVRGDVVEARLVDPPRGERLAALRRTLVEAIDDRDPGQCARTIERMLALDEPALAILGWMSRMAARRLEWGFHHGLAASADLAALLEAGTLEPGVVLLQALDLLFDDLERRPEQSFPNPAEPGEALPQLIAAEALERAEASVRAADDREALLDDLATAASDGFLDFGHSVIFTAKAEELMERVGEEAAHPILTVLARSLVYATREHTLPPMRRFVREVGARAPLRLGAGDARFDPAPFFERVLDGSLTEALDAVDEPILAGVAPDRVALALALAAGERLRRFDPRHEPDLAVAETWLHVTHALTYAEATRALLLRRPSEALLRCLRIGARFVQHLAPLDGPAADDGDALGSLVEAMDARDEGRAMALARTRPLAELSPELHRDVVSDRLTRPIFVAHHVKAVVAALRVSAAAEADRDLSPHARLALEGTVRWLCHPTRERRLGRNAHVARRFVREGRRPRELAQ